MEKYPELNKVIDEVAAKYDTTPTAIAAAWVMRHPAKVQMIAGTTTQQRMAEIIRDSEIVLERQEWYKLYLSAGHRLP